jgi:hypothetical protein
VSIFFGRTEKRESAEWFALGEGSPGAMSEERAASLAPVFATFRHLVDYISTLPADFYRIDGDKRVQVGAPELIRNVDDEYGLQQWIGQAIYGMAARGNAVGEITSLSGWSLPTMVRWAGDWSGGDGFDWWLNGRAKPDRLVAHIPWIVPPGKRLGLSPIEHYAAIVRAGLSAQDYADVKRGGGIPPAILKNSAKMLEPAEARAAQSRAVASFASGKPWVTGNDWDLTVMTIPPNHAQFIETLKLSANQIAAIYGIDPREIGGSAEESLTYTNDESRALNRAQNARPYVTRFESAVNKWLPEKTVMKLNLNAPVRADLKTRTDVIGLQLKDGRLNLDEARALEDREPLPDGQGQRYNVLTPLQAEPTQR